MRVNFILPFSSIFLLVGQFYRNIQIQPTQYTYYLRLETKQKPINIKVREYDAEKEWGKKSVVDGRRKKK